MRVVVTGEPAACEPLVAAARQAWDDVYPARDGLMTLSSLTGGFPHLVFVVAAGPPEPWLKMIGDLRARRDARALQIVVVADLDHETLLRAYDAGADGDLRPGAAPEYVWARIHAAARIVDPEARPPARAPPSPVIEGPVTPRGITPADVCARAAAWSGAAETLRAATERLLGAGVAFGPDPDPDTPLDAAFAIPVAGADHPVVLRLAVGADQASATRLARRRLHATDEAAARDAMGEIASVGMRALHAAFAVESVTFSAGLPRAIAPREVMRPDLAFQVAVAVCLHVDDARVVIHLGLWSRPNVQVDPARLREGMVLGADVLGPLGLLLVNGGARLSHATVDKLRRVLPPSHAVEVWAT